MGEAYSHLSEKERQVIQIEIGNDTDIWEIGAMLTSAVRPAQQEDQAQTRGSRPARKNHPAVPAETVEDESLDRPPLRRRARAAQGRP